MTYKEAEEIAVSHGATHYQDFPNDPIGRGVFFRPSRVSGEQWEYCSWSDRDGWLNTTWFRYPKRNLPYGGETPVVKLGSV